MIRINKDVAIKDGEIKERFVRASGPGGQNLRKEANASRYLTTDR
jgi:protein subunit release factor B